MKNIILFASLCLGASLAPAATYTIQQQGTTFSPSEVIIFAGDTVEWVWNSGSHTVTSGAGAADPDAGTMFDMPLDSSNQKQSFVYTSAGDFPFFCIPHESQGMTGVVHVQPAPLPRPDYVKIGVTDQEPPAADCSEDAHRGRMIVDAAADLLYVCTDVGWSGK